MHAQAAAAAQAQQQEADAAKHTEHTYMGKERQALSSTSFSVICPRQSPALP